jgi:dihydroorotase
MCENPAIIYKIKNKGFIKEGYDADITIVDINKEKIISGKNMQSKCGWSAFDGKNIKGWPIITIVNGNIVYENEQINNQFLGRQVEFDES